MLITRSSYAIRSTQLVVLYVLLLAFMTVYSSHVSFLQMQWLDLLSYWQISTTHFGVTGTILADMFMPNFQTFKFYVLMELCMMC